MRNGWFGPLLPFQPSLDRNLEIKILSLSIILMPNIQTIQLCNGKETLIVLYVFTDFAFPHFASGLDLNLCDLSEFLSVLMDCRLQ